MSDSETRERIPWLQGAEPRTDDYRPPRARAADREEPISPAINEFEASNDRRGETLSAGSAVNLRKLEERLTRKPLDEIATLIHGLTYGEMIELADAMWKSQPEGSAITQDNLPALLHRWCKSRVVGDGVGFS
jgi:hypothetical protein